MHKILSKSLLSYRNSSARHQTSALAGTAPVFRADGRFRSKTKVQVGSNRDKMDNIDTPEEAGSYGGTKKNVVKYGKRPKVKQTNYNLTVSERSKIGVDDSDHEDAWDALEEQSFKKQSRSPPSQECLTKKKKLDNLKTFLLKHDQEFERDIQEMKPNVIETIRPKLTNKIFLNPKFPFSHKQSTSRFISSSTKPSFTTSSAYLNPRSQDDLSHFTQLRSWIPTSLGKAVWAGQVSKESSFQFSVMSYNVLAQNLLESHPYLYRDCPSSALEWPYRWQGIKREVLDIQPDIVCLQEVQLKNPNHFQSQYEPFFDSQGYKHVMKARTGDKDDGCVIFYKGDIFTLDEVSALEYKIDRVKLLDRDNIGLVCRLVPIVSPSKPLIIGTTHLLYNPKRVDIRLCQTAMFLAELDRLARTSSGSLLPTILTGDLNSDQLSPVAHLLQSGSVQYEGLMSGKSPMPRKLLPDSLGLSDSCQWQVKLQQRGLGNQFNTGSGEFMHKFGLRSVYPAGTGVTTFQDRWTMVDYIMYSTDQARQVESQLKLVAKLGLPTDRNMHMHKIPSYICPSDHLPLVAQFLLTP